DQAGIAISSITISKDYYDTLRSAYTPVDLGAIVVTVPIIANTAITVGAGGNQHNYNSTSTDSIILSGLYLLSNVTVKISSPFQISTNRLTGYDTILSLSIIA